ncbi:hypothetical protein X975_00673, partial [Stegodyphus mimosarum]
MKSKLFLIFLCHPQKSQDRAFLGLVEYYNHYIPMFSSIAAPLTKTLKENLKKGKINWTEECTKAYTTCT